MANQLTHLFTGRSGQLATMAEFLIREMNVAIPEVDIGDDIVVVKTDDDQITRVQVKTANAKEQKKPGNFSAQFCIPLSQLASGPPHLVYAFVVRRNDSWEEFVILRRSLLEDIRIEYGIGSEDGQGNLILTLTFSAEEIIATRLSFQPFRNKFTPWPPIDKLPKGVVKE